jgi:hypothetical protein
MRIYFMLAVFGVSSCSPGDLFCSNEQIDRIDSPNEQLSAVVFSRNCGATTSYNMQISVVKKDESVRGPGNALIMDDTPEYSSELKPQWLSNRDVLLTVPLGSRVYHRYLTAEGVGIKFREK